MGKTSNECPGYDTKQSDDEFPVMLKFWGMWNTPLLLSLQSPPWRGAVTPDEVLSMGQTELNYVFKLNWIDINGQSKKNQKKPAEWKK